MIGSTVARQDVTDRSWLRRSEHPDHRRQPTPQREETMPPATSAIWDLQRSAGNQAVATLLGQSSGEATRDRADAIPVQRAGETGPPVAEPASDETTSGRATMSIPALDLVIAIDSVQMAGGPIARGRDDESSAPRDVIVSMPQAAFDPRLIQAANDGRALEQITIMFGTGLTVTLNQVHIANVSMGQDVVMLTLTAGSIKHDAGPQAEP
jgi:hypothetical protein